MVTVSIPIFHLWTLNKQEDVRLSNLGTIFTIVRIFVLYWYFPHLATLSHSTHSISYTLLRLDS